MRRAVLGGGQPEGVSLGHVIQRRGTLAYLVLGRLYSCEADLRTAKCL